MYIYIRLYLYLYLLELITTATNKMITPTLDGVHPNVWLSESLGKLKGIVKQREVK